LGNLQTAHHYSYKPCTTSDSLTSYLMYACNSIKCHTQVEQEPCYRKDDCAVRPIYKLFTLILFMLTATILCVDLILNEFKLFCKSDVSTVQGHPRSLILVPIICHFLLVHNSNLGPILHHFGDMTAFVCSWPHLYSTVILGVFPLHQIAHVGRQREQRP